MLHILTVFIFHCKHLCRYCRDINTNKKLGSFLQNKYDNIDISVCLQ